MKPKAVDFVFYAVSDYDRSLAFYRDTLGLDVSHEHKGLYAEFQAGNVTLMIGKYGQPPKEGKQVGGAIVALAVDDVAAALAELKAKNVAVTMETAEYPPCFMAMVKDPDGNEIMLHHRKDGTCG